RHNVRCGKTRMILETECAIKPFAAREPGDRREANKHAEDRNAEQLHDVTLFVMPDFMRKHGFQLRLAKLREESIEEHNFSEPSEPGKEGVRVTRSFTAVHHFDAASWKIGAQRKRKEALAQRGILRQRRELVKERHN